MEWISVEDRLPESDNNSWSQPVVAVTNLGNAYRLSYSGSADDGVWQRLASFDKGEVVEYWCELPTSGSISSTAYYNRKDMEKSFDAGAYRELYDLRGTGDEDEPPFFDEWIEDYKRKQKEP